MNKLIKGSIAGAAGVALLLGGAGTFAVWNDTASLDAPAISAGHLDLSTSSAGKWTRNGADINATTYRMIPGTTLVYTQTLTVDALGDGIKARLTHSPLIEGGTLANLVDSKLEIFQGASTTPDADGILDFTQGTSTVNVKVTIVFPDTVSGQDGQNEAIDLSNVTFTLTQTIS